MKLTPLACVALGAFTVSASVQPFEVRCGWGHTKTPDPVILTGYYDAKAQKPQLYNAATKTYVAVTDHPRIKAALK